MEVIVYFIHENRGIIDVNSLCITPEGVHL